MNIKLPKIEIKPDTVLKGVSIVLTVAGAIVTNKINTQQQNAEREKMKEEILNELLKNQNS